MCIRDSLWIRRSAMLSQVGRRERTDPQLLADTITPNIDGRDFFSRKAIGWALREYARTNPDWGLFELDRARVPCVVTR